MSECVTSQVAIELQSELLYLQMSIWCEVNYYPGFAKFFKKQSAEERAHAEKLIKYLTDRREMCAIGISFQSDFQLDKFNTSSLEYIFQIFVDNECKVTEAIDKLYEIALSEGNKSLQVMLDWFITEQVEEEALADSWYQRLRRTDEKMFFILDKEAGER